MASSGSDSSNYQTKVFTGIVTKIIDNFGFVDDDVFFQLRVVQGGEIQVGDKVFVEAVYAEHLPFKWNASKIQVVQPSRGGGQTGGPPNSNAPWLPPTGTSRDPREGNLPRNPRDPRDPRDPREHRDPRDPRRPPQTPAEGPPQQQMPSQPSDPRLDVDRRLGPVQGGPPSGPGPGGPVLDPFYGGQPNDAFRQGNFMPHGPHQSPQQPPVVNAPPPFQQQQQGPRDDGFGGGFGGGPGGGGGDRIQYTSLPGSAFVTAPVLGGFPAPPNVPLNLPFDRSVVGGGPGPGPAGPPGGPGPHGRGGAGSRWDNEGKGGRDDRRGGGGGPRERQNREREERERLRREREREQREREREQRERDRAEREKERDNEKDTKTGPTGRSQVSREREIGKSKRSESPTSLAGSQQVGRGTGRRRYEPVNVPKFGVLKSPLNVYDIKQRYASSLHIPSDLREVIIEDSFDLDVENIPKPIVFRILPPKTSAKSNEKQSESEKSSASQEQNSSQASETTESKKVGDSQEKMEIDQDSSVKIEAHAVLEFSVDSEERRDSIKQEDDKKSGGDKPKDKPNENETAASGSVGSGKTRRKYGVKVLLLSLPSMKEINDRVFGSEDDGSQSAKAAPLLHFNKIISFLCQKGSNDGHTLIGGKFDSTLDGFLPGTEKPNLIATAKRAVLKETGIDLTPCKRWRKIATFVYNIGSDYFDPEPCLEYSDIYMPDVWTLMKPENQPVCNGIEDASNTDNGRKKSVNSETSQRSNSIDSANQIDKTVNLNNEMQMNINATAAPSQNLEQTKDQVATNGSSTSNDVMADVTSTSTVRGLSEPIDNASSNVEDSSPLEISSGLNQSASSLERDALLSRLDDLKVADLRSELESRGVKIKGSVKKADLVVKLKEVLAQQAEEENASALASSNPITSTSTASLDQSSQGLAGLESSSSDRKEGLVSGEGSATIVDNDSSKAMDTLPSSSTEPTGPESQDGSAAGTNGSAEKGSDSVQASLKRKPSAELDATMEASESKRPKKSDDKTSSSSSADGSQKEPQEPCIRAFGVNLTVISLHQALSFHKYDHFELSIVSELLREFLIRHYTSYMLSALIHNYNIRGTKVKDRDQKDITIVEKLKKRDNKYLQLAFSYFDSLHCGYLLVDDLVKLIQNTNYCFSKRAFTAALGTSDRVYYRELDPPLSYYTSPDALKLREKLEMSGAASTGQQSSVTSYNGSGVVEKNGTIYHIDQLIDQCENDERLIVKLKEQTNSFDAKMENQLKVLTELESQVKKLTSTTEKQSEEITSLRRSKDNYKDTSEKLKKSMESAVSELSNALKSVKDKEREREKERESKSGSSKKDSKSESTESSSNKGKEKDKDKDRESKDGGKDKDKDKVDSKEKEKAEVKEKETSSSNSKE